MRRTIITALLAALTLAPTLVAPAAAEPPDPNHHVIDVVGRRLVAYAPFGNQELARALASSQGELVDTNNNGLANAIRGRCALLEDFGVDAFRMYSCNLQRVRADTWFTVARDVNDVVAPSRIVNYTPSAGYCVGNRTILQYRVLHTEAIVWSEFGVGTRSTPSHTFEARMTAGDPDCPDLP